MRHHRPRAVPPPPSMIVKLRVPGGPVLATRPIAAAALARHDRRLARGVLRGRPFWRGLSPRWTRGPDAGAPRPRAGVGRATMGLAAVTVGGCAALALALFAGRPGPSGDAAILAIGETVMWACYLAAVGLSGYAAWMLVQGLRR